MYIEQLAWSKRAPVLRSPKLGLQPLLRVFRYCKKNFGYYLRWLATTRNGRTRTSPQCLYRPPVATVKYAPIASNFIERRRIFVDVPENRVVVQVWVGILHFQFTCLHAGVGVCVVGAD